MSFYRDWGFTDEIADTIPADEKAPLLPARVVEPGRNEIHIVTERGRLVAEPAGRLLGDETDWPPAVGDWVVALPLDEGRGLVHRILPRRNGIARVSGAHAQPMAANVDIGLIVIPLDDPARLNLVERSLALVRGGGVSPAIALTKADVAENAEEERRRVEAVANDAPLFVVSVVTGEGIEQVASLFAPGVTVALLGKSGAGKSSLVNRLAGVELMTTGDVREGDRKGRHTTTSRRLLMLPTGGMVIDLPGFRELGLTGESEAGIDETFDDISKLAVDCRFANCLHESEPGCAVTEAVEEGTLPLRRLASYRKLLRESASALRRADEAARRAHDKRFGKMIKEVMKGKKKRG